MIKKLLVDNFKCYPNLELSMNHCTILAGGNAAGKSTVIQAILLACATLKEKNDYIDVNEVLGVSVGNPNSLISQNRVELENADFRLSLEEADSLYRIDYTIDKLFPLKLSFQCNQVDIRSRIFYLNAERRGPRISYPAGIDQGILMDGSNAAFLIDRADNEQRTIPKELAISGVSTKFSIHVEEWLNVIMGDLNFSVSTDLTKATTDIRYRNSLVDEEVLPTMTGFGISYILSIITAGLWCASIENAVLIVENPEAHLHPLAQSRMGKFLQLVSRCGVQVIIETHSEHIIDGVRIQAAVMNSTEEVTISFMSIQDGKIDVQNIQLNEFGELSEWPKGFFDQKTMDLRELFSIRRGNANK